MPKLTLGERLPDPYYDFCLNSSIAHPYRRKCPNCEHIWPTVEIPYKLWEGRGKSICCPGLHSRTVGEVITYMSPEECQSGNRYSWGTTLAALFGGIYRRRKCNKMIVPPGEIYGTEMCGQRWTTFEVVATGVAVEDVTRCDRCGAKGRLQRKTLRKAYHWGE